MKIIVATTNDEIARYGTSENLLECLAGSNDGSEKILGATVIVADADRDYGYNEFDDEAFI